MPLRGESVKTDTGPLRFNKAHRDWECEDCFRDDLFRVRLGKRENGSDTVEIVCIGCLRTIQMECPEAFRTFKRRKS